MRLRYIKTERTHTAYSWRKSSSRKCWFFLFMVKKHFFRWFDRSHFFLKLCRVPFLPHICLVIFYSSSPFSNKTRTTHARLFKIDFVAIILCDFHIFVFAHFHIKFIVFLFNSVWFSRRKKSFAKVNLDFLSLQFVACIYYASERVDFFPLWVCTSMGKHWSALRYVFTFKCKYATEDK